METIWMIAKYFLAGIFIFAGAMIFTKSIAKIVDKNEKKEEEEND